jgi:hypothetical protein
MNMEHFVPKCLWAGRRPEKTLTVPAHVACNSQFADDNEYFRTVIAFDDSCRVHPEAKRVLGGPVRRMMRNRPGHFLRQAKDYARRPRVTEMGLYLGYQPSFTIDTARIERVLQNVVKGLFYAVMGKPLAQGRVIRIDSVGDLMDENTRFFVGRMGPVLHFGDDVFACRYTYPEDKEDIACLMAFYRHKMYFATTNVT